MTEQQLIDLPYNWDFWARPAQRIPDGDWFCWLLRSGRGFGKALGLDTVVPTDYGWTTMGDIQVGETVFDENGNQCTVTLVSDIMYGHICYDVVFSDGTVITADADHEWLTWDHASRKAYGRSKNPINYPKVRTTEDIKKTLYQGKRGDINHSVDCHSGLICDYQKLPIPPYVLGVWLGDGDSCSSGLTCIHYDSQIIDEIEKNGIQIKKCARSNPNKADKYSIGFSDTLRDKNTGRFLPNGSIHSMLKSLNLFKNKHIPAIYLRASYQQRLELLQGLMDTDGHITPTGHCEYCGVNKKLVENVFELCTSMGLKASLIEGEAKLNGRYISQKYRVTFTPYINVFKLKRKADRIHSEGSQASRQKRRYIVEIKGRDSVPVRCIQVDSNSHLYLVSKSMIPTHNSRCGSETVIKWAMQGYSPIALVGQTTADVRDTMVEVGDSSIMKVAPPHFKPEYKPSKRRLTFPNGVICVTYSGDKPNQLRGQNNAKAWIDELAKFQYPQETWDNLEMGLRKGDNPQVICTTTPRPLKIIRDLIQDSRTHETRGSTLDNASNLNSGFLDRMISKYQGTRLGRQELNGDVLDDNPDALWKRTDIDDNRVSKTPQLSLVVVGVDPAVTSKEGSDDTGIVVAGKGIDNHGYILGDYTIHDTPQKWAEASVTAYHKHLANKIIGETNNGGDLVELNVKYIDNSVKFEDVHASRGKATRAEPVSLLYEQGKIHHFGVFPELEDQMCLTGNTLISTENGSIRIDELQKGDLVWTRAGLMPILWAGKTGIKETVYEINTYNGRNLFATKGHLIYIEGVGYRKVSDLRYGDVLKTWKNTDLGLNTIIDGLQLIIKDIIETSMSGYYTELFGKKNTAQFQKELLFTTSMKIDKTLNLVTSTQSVSPNINSYTPVVSEYGGQKNIVNMLKTCGITEPQNQKYVSHAGKSFNQLECVLCSVQKHAEEDFIISVKKSRINQDVYNIKVAGMSEYYANGILVHNCEWVPGAEKSPDRVDALVWALTALNLSVPFGKAAKTPVPPKDNRRGMWDTSNVPQW